MTNAVSGNTADRTRALMTEHRDLVGVFIAGIVAAILLRYVTAVAHPVAAHALLALVAVGAIVCGYLLLGRSKAETEWKLGTVAATAIGAGVVYELLTMLMS
jgi:hypothetical protein